MWEIYRESIALYNLPLTVFLSLCLVYWLLVSVGALHIRFFHFHVGGHGAGGGHGVHVGGHTAHVHIQAPAHTPGHIAVHAGGHGGAHASAAHGQSHAVGGRGRAARVESHANPLLFFLRFMNMEEVPMMVVLSFLFLFMWMVALPANYYLNPIGATGDRSYALALGLAVPNFLVSSLFTRFITFPFKKIMRSLIQDEDREQPMVGRTGTVKTFEITSQTGRIEVPTNGAPLLLQARVCEGTIPRGKEVVIYDHDADSGIVWVKTI